MKLKYIGETEYCGIDGSALFVKEKCYEIKSYRFDNKLGEWYVVVSEENIPVCRPAHLFAEIATDPKEQLQTALKQRKELDETIAKLEEQIKKEDTPKVGDRYHFDGVYSYKNSTMMVVAWTQNQKTFYALALIDVPNCPSYVGKFWCNPTEDINDIFGGILHYKFNKIQ
jgi:hypothetical protein